MTKRFKSLIVFSALIASSFVLQSCKKVEGPGGSSTIKGKVHVLVYDIADNLINEYDAPKEDVYLVYGEENDYFDDDIKTSHDGTFEFNFLQPGNYQLFVYQDCDDCPSGKDAVILNLEISDKNETLDVGTINILN